MDQVPSTSAPQPEYESQIRRAQLGLVAGYIHEMSERHNGTATSRKPGRPESPLGSISR
jgi:hypothetical protein